MAIMARNTRNIAGGFADTSNFHLIYHPPSCPYASIKMMTFKSGSLRGCYPRHKVCNASPPDQKDAEILCPFFRLRDSSEIVSIQI